MTRPRTNPLPPAVKRTLAIVLIASAQPVFAQDAEEATAEPAAAPTTAMATTSAEAIPSGGTSVTATPVVEEPAARFPRSVIMRPLTLPAGLAMLGADMTANNDFSAMGGTPIVGYGFTDELEVQVPYSFATRDFEAKGSVGVDVGYAVLRGAAGGKLEAIARVRGGYDLLGSAATPVMLGMHLQYNLSDKIALISGVLGAQQIRISVEEDATMATPIDISLPIGVGYQPTPELYLQLDTKLAQIGLSDSENLLIGKDITPVGLTVLYNVIDALDVQAAVGTDLSNAPGDSLTFLVGARYYAGQL